MKDLWLDGMDYSAAYLAWECRNTPGRTNHFCVVLQGAGPFRFQEIASRVGAIPESLLSVLNGKMKRSLWNAAPFWHPGKPEPVKVLNEKLNPSDYLNRPMNAGLECVCSGNNLYFKFDHRLFDGCGAEIFISSLLKNDHSVLSDISGESGPHLNEWKKQFSAGRKMQRHLISISRTDKIATLPSPESPAVIRTIRFDPEETARFKECSMREAGPYMTTPYLLAVAAMILKKHFRTPGQVITVFSSDLRKEPKMLFNHWGLSPLSVQQSLLKSIPAAVCAYRKSFIDCIEQKRAQDQAMASRLARIAPFPLMGRIARKAGPVLSGSFMYSCIPETKVESEFFAGTQIINLIHVPVMPVLTGLGIFMNFFRDRMNITLSMREGVLPDPDAFAYELEYMLGNRKR